MVDTRDKTLSYRRSEWLNDVTGLTLERCIKEAHKSLKNIGDRHIQYGDRVVRSVKHRDVGTGGILLHLTTETPGEAASVVPKVEPSKEELDLQIARPPADGEWLDGDAFLYVNGNHICMCATGIRDGSIRYFLQEFFKKAGIRKDATKFDLMKIADMMKIKFLQKNGVKEIVIKATMYKASADYARRKSKAVAAAGAAAKHIAAFLNKPNDVNPDGLRVAVSLKTDRRFNSKQIAIGETRLEKVAEDLLKKPENNDDFLIVTKTGQKITPNEIFMSTVVSIERDGKTVKRNKAWNELTKFYKFLHDSGALEE